MWIPHQPKRPTEGLSYRTHPRVRKERYNPHSFESQMIQCALYAWSHSFDFRNATPTPNLLRTIRDLTQLDITKRAVAQPVLRALSYEPRKLKHPKNTKLKPFHYYYIFDRLDLAYGLEWQICHWLPMYAALDTTDDTEVFLSDIAHGDNILWAEILDQEVNYPEDVDKDWPTLWDKYGWSDEARREPPEDTTLKEEELRVNPKRFRTRKNASC